MMPATICTRLAESPSRSAFTMGMPPATAASKATITPASRARAKISLPCTASSALLAVTTCLPLAMAASTTSRASVVPPITSTSTSMAGSFTMSKGSLLSGMSGPTSLRTSSGSRTTTRPIWMVQPARRLISAALFFSTSNTPLPTVPMPSSPTLITFIRWNDSWFFLSCAAGLPADSTRLSLSSADPAVARAIVGQEAIDAPQSLGQVVGIGQEHDAEVVVLRPVEAGALHQQHPLVFQQL